MMTTVPKPVLISIEGNIGSGKSTLLRSLRERHPEWHFIDEPVESWMNLRNYEGDSLLELFYGDKRRWAYTFQQTALLTRLIATEKAIAAWRAEGCPGSNVFITERCVNTDAQVFARILAEEGNIDMLEMTLYRRWFDTFVSDAVVPDAYIFVDTPVTVCRERIAGRGREGEDTAAIPIEYLDSLDYAHLVWLAGPEGLQPNVLRFDNTSKDQTRLQDVEAWVEGLASAR